MAIRGFDHVAVPLSDVEAMLRFYETLGFTIVPLGNGLAYGAHVGTQKINFHSPELWQRESFTLRGPSALPGCGDFCFAWDGDEASLLGLIERAGATVIEGPVGRDGGAGMGTSLYIRDPDGNLIEFIRYAGGAT